MNRHQRARLAVAVIVGLAVFLLGSLYNEVRQRDQHIATLQKAQQSIVDTLAAILAKAGQADQAAVAAGQQASNVAAVLERVRTVDPDVVAAAIKKAGITGPAGPAGKTGVPGPPGPAGTAAPTMTTTAAPAGTSSTTRPSGLSTTSSTRPASTTTTSSSSSTTTTTTCRLNLLGIVKGGCR